MKKVRLSNKEMRALLALQDLANGNYAMEGSCFYFRTIAKEAKMRKNDTRLACRSLARKGLAIYERGLISEQDGKMAGSGYRATEAGRTLADEQDTSVPTEPLI